MSFDGYQVAGLKKAARELVEGELVSDGEILQWHRKPDGKLVRLPSCRICRRSVIREESGEKFEDEMWLGKEGIPYHKYTFPDGRVLFERLQDEPMLDCYTTLFLALQDEKGQWVPESLWTPGELAKASVNFESGSGRGYEEDGDFWIRFHSGGVYKRVRMIEDYCYTRDWDFPFDPKKFDLVSIYHGGEVRPFRYAPGCEPI